MTNDILPVDRIIEHVSPESLTSFFQAVSNQFKPQREDYADMLDDGQDLLQNLQKLGEIRFKDGESLIVLAGKLNGDQAHRRSRLAQHNICKKVALKHNWADAGIFVFYDDENRFRFGLVAKSYSGVKSSVSSWKRFSYFIDPAEPNRTFKERVGGCKFTSVQEIQDAFSVEKVSKEFYTEIARIFTDLVGGERKIGSKKQSVSSSDSLLKYPKPDDTQRKEFAVRLIGRLVFCWFLKKKTSNNGLPLIPAEILSSEALQKTPNYYHTVLEPLFFETLNKDKSLRHKNYCGKSWDTIPFLNGGLFEAQYNDYYELDPATGLSGKYINTLKVPNEWLKAILDVFDQYNFTIDESSPMDIEVAVDPEILGRIFENLLAEINPETGETARKSTGSYYTPREIVDYMVNESLKQYLLTHEVAVEEDVNKLLDYNQSENPISPERTEKAIDALHKIKILDPACGSGAFPMGILQKIIFMLEKLDPDGQKWKEKQLQGVPDATYRKALKEKLDSEEYKYIHKLGVIRDCIYGVDIQPIAVEIAKLRVFLSLVVDETVNDRKNNRGILPLPNLEFKFVCANTLIGLGDNLKSTNLFDANPIDPFKDKLKKLREEYFTCRPGEKAGLIKQFSETQKELLKYIIDSGLCGKDGQKSELGLKLSGWKPFENISSGWFDPDWMFGIADGFDVVIGNPPYGINYNKDNGDIFKKLFVSFCFRGESYVIFIEKGLLLAPNGSVNFIIPDTILNLGFTDKIREYILDNAAILEIDVLPAKIFGNATVDTILLFLRHQKSNHFNSKTKINLFDKSKIIIDIYNPSHSFEIPTLLWKKTNSFNVRCNEKELNLIQKIDANNPFVKEFADVLYGIKVYQKGKGIPPQTVDIVNEKPFTSEIQKDNKWLPLFDGKHIGYYSLLWNNDNWLNYGEWVAEPRNPSLFEGEKILIRKITGKTLISTYVPFTSYCNTLLFILKLKTNLARISYEALLGVLNSNFIGWYFRKKFQIITEDTFPQILIRDIEQFSIPNCSNEITKKLEQKVADLLVVKGSIINAKESGKHNPDTSALEAQIDQMVYKLYDLTEEEIAIVEGRE